MSQPNEPITYQPVWTREKVIALTRLRRDGTTVTDCAVELGMNHRQVRRKSETLRALFARNGYDWPSVSDAVAQAVLDEAPLAAGAATPGERPGPAATPTLFDATELPVAGSKAYVPSVAASEDAPVARGPQVVAAEDQVTPRARELASNAVPQSCELHLDDFLATAGVDLAVWEVDKYVINRWAMGSIGPDKRPVTTPLHQIKVWLKRRDLSGAIADAAMDRFRETFLADLRAELSRPINVAVSVSQAKRDEPCSLVVNCVDPHLQKLATPELTGEVYNTEIAVERVEAAFDHVVLSASGSNLEELCLRLGDDWLNTDNGRTTTAGTPQDVDGPREVAFSAAWRLAVRLVRKAKAIPGIKRVVVKVIRGNHDEHTGFDLGEILVAVFENDPTVMIDNDPRHRKYYRYGTTLIAMSHGSEEKPADLPLIMMNERPEDFAETTEREAHLGHLHKEKETRFIAGDIVGGVRILLMPSLSGSDTWHTKKGYVGQPKALQARLYGRESGLMDVYYYTVRKQRRALMGAGR